MRAVFDLEADGYLEDATRVWCGSFLNIDTAEIQTFTSLDRIVTELVHTDLLIGHNLTGYDLPLIDKLYTGSYRRATGDSVEGLFDTYEASIALRPDRGHQGHSVESWANRIGCSPKVPITDWKNLPLERYIKRCETDVAIEYQIYLELLKEMGVQDYNELVN